MSHLYKPSQEQFDAFGRLRTSSPLTLFDSSHRYRDNNLWTSLIVGTGSTVGFVTTQGMVNIGIGTTAGCSVIRETTKVFSYQPGKALRNGEPVLTPSGWVNIENLKVGDEVFDGLGNVTKVIGVYPQGKRKLFRFTFDDGTCIDADEEHLWVTITRHNSKNVRKGDKAILSTKQMLSKYGNRPSIANRWRIPCCPVLNLEEKPVKIDPYTLGCILGDGCISHSASVCFTTSDEIILENLVCEKITKRKNDKYEYGLLGLSEYIKYYNLENKNFKEKFIPKEYKYNSSNIRLEILKGLMDTDGWVEKDGCSYFCTGSEQLCDDVCFLVRSLGGTAKVKYIPVTHYTNNKGVNIECSPSYRVKISIPVNPFKLPRKADKWTLKWRVSFDRYVYSIDEIEIDYATCIRVDSDDHTFVTRNHIITHNSLEVLNTIVMNKPQAHLSQRVGYYGVDNGIYFEAQGTTLNFVERSIVSGIMSETRTPQSQWLYDNMDGTGPSGYTLDPSKAQIFWMDIEWLGVGTVRVGFVIDGQFIHCHSFHHANKIPSTYITTASLPIRYELFNTGISTTGISTLKQICSTVISEGGYELRGLQQAISTPITSPVGLTTSASYYNVISIRLKSSPDRLDAIVILTALSLLGSTNNANYNWQLRASGTSSGESWVSAGIDSAVEYKLDGGTYSGGRILASGFFNSSQQGSTPVDILKEALFKFQLERDGLNKIPYELSLICSSDTANANVFASLDWEEISR